jgi:hypothetical protein
MQIQFPGAKRKLEPRVCPTCRQCILPEVEFFSPVKAKIWDAVTSRPRTPEQIHALVWADDVDGGPDIKALHVHIAQMNRILLAYGVRIFSGQGHRGRPYRVVEAGQ